MTDLAPPQLRSPDESTPPSPDAAQPLLTIRDLAVSFAGRAGAPSYAVNGVSLTVYPQQTVAVVGESGSGKSVTALSVLRLLPARAATIERGRIEFRGQVEPAAGPALNLLDLSEPRMRQVRGGQIAMIFQEPMTSLNPVFTVGDQIAEAVRLHRQVSGPEARAIAIDAMAEVGIADPARRLNDFPHQFSGGMRQRVMIAMALACRPRLLLADEPTTALDVTVQAQILDLLAEIRRTRGLAILLITHDLGVVAGHADVVCVMYAGRVMEYARVDELFDRPLHPYTIGLLACIPRLGVKRDRLMTVREIVEDRARFALALQTSGDRLTAWWPTHPPPAGFSPAPLSTANPRLADGYELREVSPGHWVGVWAAPTAEGGPGRSPDLAYRRSTGPRERIAQSVPAS